MSMRWHGESVCVFLTERLRIRRFIRRSPQYSAVQTEKHSAAQQGEQILPGNVVTVSEDRNTALWNGASDLGTGSEASMTYVFVSVCMGRIGEARTTGEGGRIMIR
jgi:hypothetical protein